MFSFRRKPKKAPETPLIRTPSLPELNSQGIPWPEDLVDMRAIRQESLPEVVPSKGATKTSFQGPAPIPFHKPFRPSTGKREEGPISSLYMAGPPPSAFETRVIPRSMGRYSQRRQRTPPTFNIMVVGGKGTGKTSLLRLLLETADTSPGATVDQRAAVERFLKGPPKSTQEIQTACVEICESRFDRVLFSAIDTPGFDFQDGRQLKLERQVNSVIKYVDAQYADTMNEESKVVRQSKGDQHIHLCIYMVDPASIMTSEARRITSGIPTKTRSETTVSNRTPPDLVPDTSSGDDDTDDEESNEKLTMSPAEIRVIQRLSAKTNILPVIARADSLTDEKLDAVKEAIRTGLSEAGIDLGVFEPAKKVDHTATPKRATRFAMGEPDANERAESGDDGDSEPEDEADEEGERTSRPVIKLRPTRHGKNLSRSRSRRDLSEAAKADIRRPVSPDDAESVANVRFSAHIVAKTDLTSLMPFALIAPEPNKHRPRPDSVAESLVGSMIPPDNQLSENGHSLDTVPSTPASVHSPRNYAFLQSRPEDLKGVFVRKFRWGMVDVLNPNHCDYAALRTTVFSTHLKLLKIRTKEVLYEKYRTEKLLARRATANISEDERQRLLEGLPF
ncbi:septin family protein [Crepidotus variabilis]|uniref:Septin family protein n=1 Tax=Crepidotus variabilis TaxID=179855 RepID=A0A9P6EQL6_9AGAR|nr:septin family protein [Crepidotus variabilis]